MYLVNSSVVFHGNPFDPHISFRNNLYCAATLSGGQVKNCVEPLGHTSRKAPPPPKKQLKKVEKKKEDGKVKAMRIRPGKKKKKWVRISHNEKEKKRNS